MNRSVANETLKAITRRHFFGKCATGIGTAALGGLLNEQLFGKTGEVAGAHFAGKAKGVIYLHMAGAPSQLDMFDYKPKLKELSGQSCPESLFKKDRFAFIKGVPKLLGTPHEFGRHGQAGTELSTLLPHLATISDDICVIRSMYTDQFNHAPAQIFLHTGSPRQGRPSMGSWLTYGLGAENRDLPAFVVLVSGGKTPDGGASLWGSGFLPTVYQGVQCRAQGDPVLYVSNPQGMSTDVRRDSLDALKDLNELQLREFGDPETVTRISQYELAYRMQTSVPELMQIAGEPQHIHELYGTDPGKVSFANNCLLARRLVERGVRFVLLFHWGWDQHGDSKDNDIRDGLRRQCRQTDQPSAALVKDLKQRGLLEQTLVAWGGEFGRTPMDENRTGNKDLWGRDHHPHAFTMWLAGGGIKGGVNYGATDDLGYHATDNKVHVHDLQATMLHCLGLDHERLTYRFQGRDYRLTDVHGEVVRAIVS